MRRKGGALAALATMIAMAVVIGVAAPNAGTAQEEDLRPTVQAMQTEISTLQTQVAGLMPPTPRAGQPTPTRAPRATSGGNGLSMGSPLAVGDVGRVGDYEVRVVSIDPDAEDEVLAENMFNEPAGAGQTMFMVTLEMTYVGTDKGNVFWDLTYTFVGSDGRAFTDTEADCGVVPNGLIDAPDLYPGANTEVNVCWVAAASAVDAPVMVLEELFAFDSEPVYFAMYD